MNDHSYTNDEGYTVLKSSFHLRRGTCCKTNCLHCPFGTTVNKLGFTFNKVTSVNITLANQIINSSSSTDEFTSTLLSSAFGNIKQVQVTPENVDLFSLMYLKESLCGLVKVEQDQVSNFWLKEHFRDQNINIGSIQKSFFP